MSKRDKTENNIFLKDFDYEKYQLVLPYRFLFGRKRQRFIYSELEKKHPCFSGEFCYDSTIRKVSKKGFVSDVMVIHKNKLAEYEAKRYLSASGIGRITGTGFLVDFSTRRRFFVNEKLKRVFAVSCFFVIAILILFVLTGVLRLTGRTKEESIQKPGFVEEQPVPAVDDVEESFSLRREVCEKFFNCINAAGGRVLTFRWEILNGSEILEAKVKGVFPEQLDGFDMPDVSYEAGIPMIQVCRVVPVRAWKSAFKNGVRVGDMTEGRFDAEFYKSVRKALTVNGAVLKEERPSPYLIRFSCNEKVMGTLFADVAGCFADAGVEVCSVRVMAASGSSSGTQSGDFEISIGGVGAAPAPGIDLAVVGENTGVFGEIKNQPKSSSQNVKQNLPAKNKIMKKTEGQKIGEIKTSEGKVIVFYKTSEGKIKKIMEEQKK